MKPLVSVGMPIYNAAKYLREALDALLGQTYGNFELIISDNASTDETEAICREYAERDRRIRYIRQEKNIFGIPNFNFVLREAKGDYFMWAAHDDIRGARFLEKCIEKFLHDPGLSMVFCRFERFDEKSGERHPYNDTSRYLPTERDIYKRLKRHILLYWSEGKAVPIYGLWNRRKIGDDRFAFNEFYFGFDVNFIFRNLTRGPFAAVEETLFFKSADFSKPVEAGVPSRIFQNVAYRLGKVFSPLFYLNIFYILRAPKLNIWGKIRLVFWEIVAIARLFVVRKM